EALEVYRCKKSFLSDISATHVGVRPSFYRTRILSKPLMMRDNFNSLLRPHPIPALAIGIRTMPFGCAVPQGRKSVGWGISPSALRPIYPTTYLIAG
ncbi:hypothetical protein, partial [Microbulbifer discodermiae]|uniref:hypothetical protein n=1 Tax=Microbulbifer sp. 2201CG32-9 TaxID=3232309 RepID=UPI00345C6089